MAWLVLSGTRKFLGLRRRESRHPYSKFHLVQQASALSTRYRPVALLARGPLFGAAPSPGSRDTCQCIANGLVDTRCGKQDALGPEHPRCPVDGGDHTHGPGGEQHSGGHTRQGRLVLPEGVGVTARDQQGSGTWTAPVRTLRAAPSRTVTDSPILR